MTWINILALMTSFVLAACDSKEAEKTDAVTAEKVDATPAVANRIAALGAEIYNTNWVGKPCTTVNKTTTCSAGGTVVITGSFSCPTGSNGVQNMNLNFTYEMDKCTITSKNISVSLTGTMTHTGSSTNVSSIITAETVTFKADKAMKIVAKGTAYKKFDKSCKFSVVSKKSDATSDAKLSGILCTTPL